MSADGIKWSCAWQVQKWDEEAVAWLTQKLGRTPLGADFEAAGLPTYEHNDIPGNLLTTAGLTRITSLIVGAGGQAASQTAARIGIGDSTTAVAVGDTALGAATNKLYHVLDGAPSTSGGQMTFVATFGSSEANYHWQEFCVDIGTPTVSTSTTVSACLLNHKLSDQGTKTSGQSWTATCTITLS